jgi:F0F1-type ATP synthase assembly protein I
MDEKTKQALKQLVQQGAGLTALGFVLVITTAVGLAAGVFLDRWLVVTRPWGTILGILFGVVAGFYNILNSIRPPAPKDRKP